MRRMIATLLLCGAAASGVLYAQTGETVSAGAGVAGGSTAPAGGAPSRKQVSLTFDRKGVPVGHYRMAVYDDATVVYEGSESTNATAYGAAADQTARPFQHRVKISSATMDRIFSAAARAKRFDMECESKVKNIADMGKKTLRYEGPDGTGSCTYNFTEDKDVQSVTSAFQGMAETLDEGRKLDQLRRFDRLGLDVAMKRLADAVASGDALEIGMIASSLRSIAADSTVMTRVRNRANDLLTQAAAGSPAPPAH